MSAMGTKNNQIRSPRFCLIEDDGSRFTLRGCFTFAYVQSRGAQYLSSIGNGISARLRASLHTDSIRLSAYSV